MNNINIIQRGDFNLKSFVAYYLPINRVLYVKLVNENYLLQYLINIKNQSHFTTKMFEDLTNTQKNLKIKYVSEVVHSCFF